MYSLWCSLTGFLAPGAGGTLVAASKQQQGELWVCEDFCLNAGQKGFRPQAI